MPTQVDDELEKYAAKPASGDDELEKYAQKPAPKSGSLDEYLSKPFDASGDDLENKVEKENLTPRMRAAVSSGAAKMQPPTRFEKEHTPAPEDTGVWNRLKQYAGDVGHMATGVLDLFGNPVPTIGKISDIATSAASRAVPNKGQEGLSGARSPVYNAIATGAQALGVADPSSMEASAEHGDPTGVLTHAAAQLTPVAAAELARTPVARKTAGAVADTVRAIPNIPDKAALALRTEEGAVHPAVTRTIGAIGGASGAALGHYLGVPEAGAIAGYGIGTAAADRLIPNLPHDIPTKTPIGATLPSAEEFYENTGIDKLKRGKEQATLDRQAAREAKANPPFETPGSAPATLPSAEEFYEHRGTDLLRRGAQEEALAKKQAAAGGTIPKIVSPTEGEPRTTGSEGRAATWTNERVQQLASEGNRDAISQAVRRGMELPPNARYVMGDPDFPRAVLNPREVTLFSPEGIPIRNKSNAQAEANQGTIPTISRTPRGKIPNIGEQAPPLAAQPPTKPAESPTATETKPLGPVVAKDRSARIAANAKRLEQGLQAKQGGIANIGEAKPSGFKVPTTKPIAPQAPPTIQPVLDENNWRYVGKNAMGQHEIEEPGTNIKVLLFDRDLNPSFVARKIAEKEKQYGVSKIKNKVSKANKEGTEIVE